MGGSGIIHQGRNYENAIDLPPPFDLIKGISSGMILGDKHAMPTNASN